MIWGNSRSLSAARQRWQVLRPSRVIADLRFEGENEDGLTLLEEVHLSAPQTELVLCTGNTVFGDVEDRARRIGATILEKSRIDLTSLEDLLTPGRQLQSEPEAVDVALLRLEADTLRKENRDLMDLNNMFIKDLVKALKEVHAADEDRLSIAGRRLSVDQLRIEVEQRTDLGIEVIQLYNKLNEKLRMSSK